MLELTQLTAGYGAVTVLHGIDLHVRCGEIVCLLGGNASGKTTTMKAITGLVKPLSGQIVFENERIDRMPTASVVHRGIALVPEGRGIFSRMTVRENLLLGADGGHSRHAVDEDLDRIHAIFPRLLERAGQYAGTLSGGEQQMLAMARGLMMRPRLLLLDEPSMGLSPAYVDQVFDVILDIHRQGTTILLVEQNASMALSIASRGYVLQGGRIVAADSAAALLAADDVRRAYLGDD
ncbi:ABC transporter ATP-binding protein [Brucella sp. IR073]|uniref:ABC transporter ATP-binding protein n=1 Tax=unclassified Brucella TaxID=2632610 RepID=UPI003B981046